MKPIEDGIRSLQETRIFPKEASPLKTAEPLSAETPQDEIIKELQSQNEQLVLQNIALMRELEEARKICRGSEGEKKRAQITNSNGTISIDLAKRELTIDDLKGFGFNIPHMTTSVPELFLQGLELEKLLGFASNLPTGYAKELNKEHAVVKEGVLKFTDSDLNRLIKIQGRGLIRNMIANFKSKYNINVCDDIKLNFKENNTVGIKGNIDLPLLGKKSFESNYKFSKTGDGNIKIDIVDTRIPVIPNVKFIRNSIQELISSIMINGIKLQGLHGLEKQGNSVIFNPKSVLPDFVDFNISNLKTEKVGRQNSQDVYSLFVKVDKPKSAEVKSGASENH
jgi:hypothetical protein